jgi:hypothetical protein
MPWPVIVTTLLLSIVSAWLVFVRNWEPLEAFGIVAVAAVSVVLVLLAAILLLSDTQDRAGVWQVFVQTLRSDFDQALKYFRLRR